MKFAQPAAFALLALSVGLAVPGCRMGAAGNLAPPTPASPPAAAMTKAQVIERINRNARLVESLKSKRLSVNINVADRESHSVDGKMALERPRNFKLELYSARGKEADIGSNDKGFWFWTRPGPGQPKEIFVCDYDATGKSPLEGPLQPDWIIESLGLREISEDEAAGITIEPTNSPDGDTVALAQSFRGGSGATYKKVTLVDKSSGLVRENRLYRIDKDRKTPLATAVVSDSQRVSLPADEAKAPGAPRSVVLPSKVKLAWYTPDRQNPDIPQKLEIDVRLLGPPELNKPVPHELFEEYTYKGLVRVPLNEPFGIAKSPSTEIRETRPAPRTGVQLGEPDAAEGRPDDSAQDNGPPVALSGDLPPISSLKDTLVAAPLPTAPEPEFPKERRTTWRSAVPPVLER